MLLLEKVVKLVDSAVAPLEALASVPQVAHDVTVLPPANKILLSCLQITPVLALKDYEYYYHQCLCIC